MSLCSSSPPQAVQQSCALGKEVPEQAAGVCGRNVPHGLSTAGLVQLLLGITNPSVHSASVAELGNEGLDTQLCCIPAAAAVTPVPLAVASPTPTPCP